MRDTLEPVRRGWRQIERYVYVGRAYDDVWPYLAGHLSSLGEPMPDGGRAVELHIRPAGREVSRPVRLHVGGFICGDDRTRASLEWADATHPRAFPQLEASLEIMPVPHDGPAFTQLGVVARYRPPLGALGLIGDRLAGAEVVDASITEFLDELAGAVAQYVPVAQPGPAAAPGEEPPGGDDAIRRLLLPVDGLAVRPGGAVGAWAALSATPGVVHVSIDPGAGLAAVDHDPAACSLDDVTAALEDQPVASEGSER